MDFPESSTTNFKLITTNLKTKIEEILENNRDLTSINLIVAFITYKGSRILLDWIKKYSLQNVRFKILTGTYADFTHPDALELLSDRENLSVKILDTIQDFKLHAKAYFIESPKKKLFILGSSNLTEGALTSNIEWNAIIDQFENQNYYEYCINQFSYLWNNAIDLTKDWIAEYRIRYKYSNAFDREREERDFDSSVPIPRFAQPEALESLERSRRQGFSSALVVLATGLGKTHLSAFDSIQYRKVLFIAHVKEILEQAEKIFKQVRKFGKIGNLEEGWHVLDTCDVIFATVQKISRDRNLTRFNQKQFDYIIVDEFHHAETSSYRKVLEYFSPIFLLGMTATPFRMDRQDITELCETNVPYICNMPDAIEKKWLIPFEYYGINDTTVDYEQIKWTSRGYDEKELTVNLNKEKRAEFILEEFKKYPVDPTVGFCATIEHADYMTEYFNTKGVPALAVHSGTNGKSPDVAKDKVKAKEIRVIFAVNVFNEGIDLPDIRKVMLLRPTESMTIFIQQIGRGLRKAEQKNKLLILDFIGNYAKSYTVPALLLGRINPHIGKELFLEILDDVKKSLEDPEYESKYPLPPGCSINFELTVIENMIEKLGVVDPIRQGYINKYNDLKREIGHRPEIRDLMSAGETVSNFIIAFKSMWNFYREIGDLTIEEEGYHKEEITMLSWLEKIYFETPASLEIVKIIFQQEETVFSIEEVEQDLKNWISEEQEREAWLDKELSYFKIEKEESSIKYLIKEVIQKKIPNHNKYSSGIHVEGEELKKSLVINWFELKESIDERLYLRENEFIQWQEEFQVGALYGRKDIKKHYARKKVTENIEHFFGERAGGIIRLGSIKEFIMFVTQEKEATYQEANQDYKDKLLDRITMQWESQNITRLESENGRIIREVTPGYTKHVFMRLRGKDKYYGSNFFYLGKVSYIEHQGEAPITVKWRFEKTIPEQIYTYLTVDKYRRPDYRGKEFVEEEI